MQDVKTFFDTNMIIYAYSNNDEYKKELSLSLFDNSICHISYQVIREFINIFTKLGNNNCNDLIDIVNDIISTFEIAPESTDLLLYGIIIRDKYKFSYYDSLIISAALLCNCSILYSEDMQHGQLIENKLKIINPFI